MREEAIVVVVVVVVDQLCEIEQQLFPATGRRSSSSEGVSISSSEYSCFSESFRNQPFASISLLLVLFHVIIKHTAVLLTRRRCIRLKISLTPCNQKEKKIHLSILRRFLTMIPLKE